MVERLQLIVLNELSLAQVLFAKCQGRQPLLMDVDSLIPFFSRSLKRIRDWLIKHEWARSYASLDDEFKAIDAYWPRVMFYDVFGDTEAWQNQYFEVDTEAEPLQGYGYAEQHVICNFAKSKHVTFLVARKLNEQGITFDIVGAPHDTASGLAAYASLPQPTNPTLQSVLHRVFNAATTFLTLFYTYFWIFRRVKFTQQSTNSVFLAADYNGDTRDNVFLEDIQDGGPLLVVQRNHNYELSAANINVSNKIISSLNACHTSFTIAVHIATETTFDILNCYFRRGHQRIALFSQLIKLPFRRAQYRIFFSTYRPKYYWGRDDYNEQHIIRRQELHRIGGVSLGLNHGYSHYANVYPMWRCISFDVFFTAGMAQYNRYTKDLWAYDMKVVPAGPFGATRKQLLNDNEPISHDIAVFCSGFIGYPSFVAFIRALAEAFPEKTVWLQVKATFVSTMGGQDFIQSCVTDRPNVRHTTAPLYNIFAKVAYVFSDPSTIIVEALHFGCFSFFADVFEQQKRTLYREFPDFCVTSATAAISKIQRLDKDPAAYPREKAAELVDLSGIHFIDHVRTEIGLPVRPTTNGASE